MFVCLQALTHNAKNHKAKFRLARAWKMTGYFEKATKALEELIKDSSGKSLLARLRYLRVKLMDRVYQTRQKSMRIRQSLRTSVEWKRRLGTSMITR